MIMHSLFSLPKKNKALLYSTEVAAVDLEVSSEDEDDM